MKSITLYCLSTKENKDKPLVYTLKKSECIEYAFPVICFKHYAHFVAWCKTHDKNCDAHESHVEYVNTCIPQEEKEDLIIGTAKFKLDDVAALVRMFSGVTPFGCSFEKPMENTYFQARCQDFNRLKKLAELEAEQMVSENSQENKLDCQ